RQSKLKPRPAKILKWEGIIVDPLGVLLAVFAFEIISFFTSGSNNVDTLLLFFFGSALAVLIGWLSGRSIGWLYYNGHIQDVCKSSAVTVSVHYCFTISFDMDR